MNVRVSQFYNCCTGFIIYHNDCCHYVYFDVEPNSADDPVSELQLVISFKARDLINLLYIIKTTTG